MSVKFVDRPPTEIEFTPHLSDHPEDHDDLEHKLKPEHVDQVAEIFRTPLTGAYTWNYEECDEKIRRLYRLGKELNWNAEIDVDWSYTHPKTQFPFDEALNPFLGTDYDKYDQQYKLDIAWHNHSWTMSQFLHGEQGALLVASQLVSCAPTYDAKLYAASQTFDEARHVEVFGKYLQQKVGFMYPINKHLKALLDKILTDPRWDLKFIGMQIIIEGLALAAFRSTMLTTRDNLLRNIVDYVIRDESRHVAFGVLYMEEFVKSLSQEEREDRAMFAYEACVVMRERLIATDVFEHFGWDVEYCRKKILDSKIMVQFRNLLFTRIMPNLAKVGLLTDNVRPKYEQLGLLQYENLLHDGEVDWAQLEQKYPKHKVTPPQAVAA